MNSRMVQTKRDAYFDNVRLFLMFVVVMCHGLERIRGTSYIIIAVHEMFLSFVMPLFVFLTGFFAKGMANESSPKRMRIINIICLYVIVQFVKNIIGGYDSFLKPTYGNWFLIGLCFWYIVLPFFKKIKPFIGIGLSIIVGVLIGIDSYANTVLQLSRVVCFFPFFLMGFYFPKEQTIYFKQKGCKKLGLVLFVMGTLFCLLYWNEVAPLGIMHANKSYEQMKMSGIEGCTMRVMWYIITTLMGFAVMSLIPSTQTKLTIIGTRTLPIFIIHTILYLYLYKRTGFFVGIQNFENELVQLIIIFVFSVFVTIMCGNKFFASIFDKFMGYDFHIMMNTKK